MKRLVGGKYILKGILLGALLAAAAVGVARAEKPNIVFIFADDLGYGDIGPFGSTKNRTPNLDRMAKEGMKLTSFYGAPVCTPSRAQVMTGCYAKRVGLPKVLGTRNPIGINKSEHTIAELLKAEGYATMAVGKWHLGDHVDFLPTRHGFDHYLGLPYSNDMDGYQENAKPAENKKPQTPPLPLIRDEQVIEEITRPDQDRLTERYTEEALKFIRSHKDKPFFLYLAHTAVHTPIHPGSKFRGKSANGIFGDWVEELDWSVGQVMDELRELKLSERTLVIFSSDNGPWLRQGRNAGTAAPLRGGKAGTYEGGMREPTLAWWPGKVPAGSVCDAVAGNIDLLPTFVSVAEGKVPTDKKIDGKDISALLFGKSKESPREAQYYFEASEKLEAVRCGPWKLAIVKQSERKKGLLPGEGEPITPVLYNLDEDIGETTDVASKHPDVVKRLERLIAKMDADLGKEGHGPGVREPGRVSDTKGMWLPGKGPKDGK